MGIVYEKYLLLASKMCYLSAFFVSSGIAGKEETLRLRPRVTT